MTAKEEMEREFARERELARSKSSISRAGSTRRTDRRKVATNRQAAQRTARAQSAMSRSSSQTKPVRCPETKHKVINAAANEEDGEYVPLFPDSTMSTSMRKDLLTRLNAPNVTKEAPYGTSSARSMAGDWRYNEPRLLNGARTPAGRRLSTPKVLGQIGGHACFAEGTMTDTGRTGGNSARSVATTIGGHKKGQPPFAQHAHIRERAMVDLACSTSCVELDMDVARRPALAPVQYKQRPEVDQFARNHLKGAPYATHENLPTNRMVRSGTAAPFNARGASSKSLASTRQHGHTSDSAHQSDGPILVGRDNLLWDDDAPGKLYNRNGESRNSRTRRNTAKSSLISKLNLSVL